jgi:hypothetical protein
VTRLGGGRRAVLLASLLAAAPLGVAACGSTPATSTSPPATGGAGSTTVPSTSPDVSTTTSRTSTTSTSATTSTTGTTTTSGSGVVLKVTGSGSADLTLQEGSNTSHLTDVPLPWSETVADNPAGVGVTATGRSGSPSTISCELDRPGQSPDTSSSSGTHPVVTCSDGGG